MADYYPLLARALDGLTENTRATRAEVYGRAKTYMYNCIQSYILCQFKFVY